MTLAACLSAMTLIDFIAILRASSRLGPPSFTPRALAAVIFNPFIPLHLTRGAWSILNIAAGALFVGHYFYRSFSSDQAMM
jgi:hypothetical protein